MQTTLKCSGELVSQIDKSRDDAYHSGYLLYHFGINSLSHRLSRGGYVLEELTDYD